MNEIDDSLLRQLYRLPPEIFIRVLDFLNFNGILRLCYDPDFPFHLIHRRHIEPGDDKRSILHAAAKIGYTHIPAIKEVMKILGTWDSEDRSYMTPLAIAAQKPNYQLCQAFLQAGARVDGAGDMNEYLPLWHAAGIAGNGDTVSLLLEYGAKGSCSGDDWEHAIHCAVQISDKRIVELLLHSGADPNACAVHAGTLFHCVKDPEIAKLLFAHGADVNALGDGDTSEIFPLMLAAESGSLELVQTLLDGGAEVNPDVWLGNGLSALVRAVDYRLPDIVKLLVEAGGRVNDWDDIGNTALRLAVYNNDEDIVRILLEAGADITETDSAEESILFAAATHDNPPLLQALMDFGAEIEPRDKKSRTSLFTAVEHRNAEIVQMLLDANYNPSHTDSAGIQPAILATIGSEDDLCDIANNLSEGRSINWISNWISEPPFRDFGESSLGEDISILNMLFKHGADVSQVNYCGLGILHFAVWRSSVALIRILLDEGADPLHKDPQGHTTADWAADLGHTDVETILREAEASRLSRQT